MGAQKEEQVPIRILADCSKGRIYAAVGKKRVEWISVNHRHGEVGKVLNEL